MPATSLKKLDLPFTLTNSNMKMFKNCPQMGYYRQVEHLVPRIQSDALGIGSGFHKGAETGSVEQALAVFANDYPSTQEEMNALEIKKATVQAMVEGYGKAFKQFDNIQPEIKFSLPIINPATGAPSKSFNLSGKADGLMQIDGKWWLLELKTAGQINKTYIDRLMLDSQITTYFYAMQRAKGINLAGIIYRIVKKPSIYPRKGESINQFCERLIADYQQRPEFYFFEEKLYRTQDDLKLFERELWMFTQYLLLCNREGLWYRNPSKCGDYGRCQYMPLCLQEQDAIDLYEVKEPNSELKEEQEDGTAAA